MQHPSQTLLIIAGEPSGDIHGGALVQRLKAQHPEMQFIGCGGDHMIASGVRCFAHIKKLAVMGFIDIIMRLPQLMCLLMQSLYHAHRHRPCAIVLIDYPGFNLLLARCVKHLNIPILYYIAPKVWASRPRRIQTLKRCVDHLAVIFPFEVQLFQDQGCTATYVGNPLSEITDTPATDSTLRERLKAHPGTKTIALLPGSRRSEWQRLYPLMMETAQQLSAHAPNLRFILAQHPNLSDFKVKMPNHVLHTHDAREAIRCADLVLVASGTATLEATVLNTPMVVTYQTSRFNAWLAKKILISKYVSLPNILAHQTIVPEYLQSDATVSQLAQALQHLLDDPQAYATTQKALKHVATQLKDHPITPLETLITQCLSARTQII